MSDESFSMGKSVAKTSIFRYQMMKMTPIQTLIRPASFDGDTRPGLREWKKQRKRKTA